MLLCLLFLAVFFTPSIVRADETADRAAIAKVINILNSSAGSPGLFTDDFAENVTLVRLGVYRYGVPVSVSGRGEDVPTAIYLDALRLCVSQGRWPN
jgi:hypothetical protein